MTSKDGLIKVGRHAVVAAGKSIPATFFKHGQPGQRFVVSPVELNWRSHVRVGDLKAILSAYEQSRNAQPPTKRPKRKGKPAVRPTRKLTPARRDPQAGASRPPVPRPVSAPADSKALQMANRLAKELAALKQRAAEGASIKPGTIRQLERQHQTHLDRHLRQSGAHDDEINASA